MITGVHPRVRWGDDSNVSMDARLLHYADPREVATRVEALQRVAPEYRASLHFQLYSFAVVDL